MDGTSVNFAQEFVALLAACREAKNHLTTTFEGWRAAELEVGGWKHHATKENFGPIIKLGEAIDRATRVLQASDDERRL